MQNCIERIALSMKLHRTVPRVSYAALVCRMQYSILHRTLEELSYAVFECPVRLLRSQKRTGHLFKNSALNNVVRSDGTR